MNRIKNYLIVANGNFLAKEIIHEIAKNKIIIALDEAADKLFQFDIIPHILLGDFDSDNQEHLQHWGIRYTLKELEENQKPYQGHHNVTIVPRKNQNYTDLIKAIHYCDEESANSITIICATGGRLDHHEAALRSLRTEYKKEREIVLHTDSQTLRFIKDDSFIIKGEIKDSCAILAFPHAILTTQGLTYDVKDYELNFGYSESIGNSLRLKEAHVSVTGEALLMLPLELKSQRKFSM
jgi:thiamine pyrophosphokinase